MAATARFDDRHHSAIVLGTTNAAHPAILDRSNITSGQWGLELAGADNVIVSGVSITGARIGVYAADAAGSNDLSLSNVNVYGNGQIGAGGSGVWLGLGNDRPAVNDSRITDNTGWGVYFGGQTP